MFITRKHPKVGASLKTYPIAEDPQSGLLGYKIGYTECPCGHCEPILIRTIDVREIVDKFGVSEHIYRKNIVDKLVNIFK